MFLPYGTDAPIYYWPKATVGLIVANVLVFFATVGLAPDDRAPYMLLRGDGLHPLQWLTSFFMHAGLSHLIGNMIFLWAFGIVVEGKLGALRFLPVYLGVGVAQSALMQVISLHSEHGYILGASAAIYGLLAICLVWAPLNELNCLVFFRFSAQQIDVAILWFALGYIGLEFFFVLLTKGAMSTPFLHLTGAVIGFAVGVVMLKAGLVDCENWDLFAMIAGRKGLSPAQGSARKKQAELRAAPKVVLKSKTSKKRASNEPKEDPADAATRRLRGFLEAGEPLAAHAAYDKALRTVAGWQPPGPDWLALIKVLLDAKESRTAIAVMETYLSREANPSPRVRLKLAQILIKQQERPAHALRVLDGFQGAALPESLEATRRQLVAEAERMREEGVLELDGDAW
jgi:membrane associated rhomboid family serine protease